MTRVILFHHPQGLTSGVRGAAAIEGLDGSVVYAGFFLGVLPAQMLAQTRPTAVGALLGS